MQTYDDTDREGARVSDATVTKLVWRELPLLAEQRKAQLAAEEEQRRIEDMLYC